MSDPAADLAFVGPRRPERLKGRATHQARLGVYAFLIPLDLLQLTRAGTCMCGGSTTGGCLGIDMRIAQCRAAGRRVVGHFCMGTVAERAREMGDGNSDSSDGSAAVEIDDICSRKIGCRDCIGARGKLNAEVPSAGR
jgi:hypothetical protein